MNMERICKAVLKLSETELAESASRAAEQCHYTHPLKHGTAIKVRAAGAHNVQVIAKLRELREVLMAGSPNGRRGVAAV